MMDNYQDEIALEADEREPEAASFATISEIYDDGVTLIFDGGDAPTQKHYLTNMFVVFAAGQRVRVIKDSGTYVVEYPVGAPRKTMTADSATEADKAAEATKATEAVSWTGGHTGDKIGFFGQTPVARATGVNSVSTISGAVSSSATLTQTISALNTVIGHINTLIGEHNALVKALDYRGYGLIQ